MQKEKLVRLLLDAFEDFGSWPALSDEMGIPRPTLWKAARDPNYIPGRKILKQIRDYFGIKPTYQRFQTDCYHPALRELIQPIIKEMLLEMQTMKIKAVIDQHTCDHCRKTDGRPMISAEEFLDHQENCTDQNGCRCVAVPIVREENGSNDKSKM